MSQAPERPAEQGVELDVPAVGDPVPCFGFQADTMSPEDNAAAWREAVGTLFEVDELAWGELEPFRADLVSYALGPVVLGATRASSQRFRRTPETIARSGVDHVIVQLYTSGGYDGVAGNRPMQVRAGDICVFDLAQVLETRATAFANVTLVVPRPRMEACLSHPEALHGLVLPGTNVAAALIGRHLQALIELAPAMTLADCAPVIEGSVGLIAACLRAEMDRSDSRADAGEADLLIRIKRQIEGHLGDPGLSGASVARHFGLSRSTLYRLFTPYGGVAAYVRSRRLHRAFFELTAPGARIKEVARRWQLGSGEVFNRSFKAAYGITPKMARSASALAAEGRHANDDAPRSQLSRWMRSMGAPSRTP